MWKQFKYNGRDRVAYIAYEGPAFQVLDAGEPKTGFRAFNMSKAEDVKPAPNRFDLIPPELVEKYPELKLALHV